MKPYTRTPILTGLLSILLMGCTTQVIQADLISSPQDQFSPTQHKLREIHHSVLVNVFGVGESRVYLFVPASPKLKKNAPIVFLHHGWLGWDPKNFGALIDHLVRTGNVVIYPAYQDSARTPTEQITDNAARANRVALDQLDDLFKIKPDPKQIVYFGFSIGAAISLNLAQDYQKYQLPKPSALVLVGVGDAYHAIKNAPSIIKPLENLPRDLPIVMMTGEDDPIGLPTVRKRYAEICHIRSDRRILMVLPSDQHLMQKVTAGHGSIGAPDSRYAFALKGNQYPNSIAKKATYEVSASLNQLDFYGYWKILDSVLDGLKSQTLSPLVFGKGHPQQLFLGTWPDGSPLKLMRLETPCGH